ncbi:MAG: tRNA (adenosine(37)-N6)-threonylcarbamoyltransferase complex dimerization subunit type 1 TsaB, partial [Acidimicrobiia bacterium]
MKILAIETATAAASVALGEGREPKAMTVQVDRRGHVGFLVPALEFCLRRLGWSPSDIEAVVVDVGPGLFSGIRAGLSTAQGIAAAL